MPQVSGPKQELGRVHNGSRRIAPPLLRYVPWRKCQPGDHLPPASPCSSNWVLMNDWQISICPLDDMHQEHTDHSSQKEKMNLLDHKFSRAYQLPDGISARPYILQGNHVYSQCSAIKLQEASTVK
uniref:Uncharacterized protein n=2 Tax=Opuntia streptacantha TaxID=393608 RepID=A0A7C8YQ56_OPUST